MFTVIGVIKGKLKSGLLRSGDGTDRCVGFCESNIFVFDYWKERVSSLSSERRLRSKLRLEVIRGYKAVTFYFPPYRKICIVFALMLMLDGVQTFCLFLLR